MKNKFVKRYHLISECIITYVFGSRNHLDFPSIRFWLRDRFKILKVLTKLENQLNLKLRRMQKFSILLNFGIRRSLKTGCLRISLIFSALAYISLPCPCQLTGHRHGLEWHSVQWTSPIPCTLFETDIFQKHYPPSPTPSDYALKFRGTVVLVSRRRKSTVHHQLDKMKNKFVKRYHLISECKVKVVFDLYQQEPTSKDWTHLRRSQRVYIKIRVANDTVIDLTKPQFLYSRDTKQSFVDVALKLAKIPEIECVKARADADCLIIDTALLATA